jgi:hypothetical protein
MNKTLLLVALVAFAGGCGGDGGTPNYDNPLQVHQPPRPFRGTGPALESTTTDPQAPRRTHELYHPVDDDSGRRNSGDRPGRGGPGDGDPDDGDIEIDCWEICEGDLACLDFCESF